MLYPIGLLSLVAALATCAGPVRAEIVWHTPPGSEPTEASNSRNCGDRRAVARGLAARFGEMQRGLGFQSAARVTEIWVSEATGTWTVLETRANGQTCILGSGGNWHWQDADSPLVSRVRGAG